MYSYVNELPTEYRFFSYLGFKRINHERKKLLQTKIAKPIEVIFDLGSASKASIALKRKQKHAEKQRHKKMDKNKSSNRQRDLSDLPARKPLDIDMIIAQNSLFIATALYPFHFP